MSHRVEQRPLPGFDAPPPRPAKRKRPWIRVIAFFLVLLASAATYLFQPSWLNYLDQPIVFWDDEPGYTRYIDTHTEWTLRFPDSWHVTYIAEKAPRTGRYRPHSYGVLLSNIEIAEKELWNEGMPSELVAVRVAFDYFGGWTNLCDHDTPLPLQLGNASQSPARVKDAEGGTVTAFYLPFAVRREAHYSVRAWIASQVSQEDRATLDQIVKSIHYPKYGMPRGWVVTRCPMDDELKKLGGKVS